MKKDITMKKNTFVKGALITTLGVIFTKILGILYVIPFHALIGEKGGALYGYAYTVYSVFISLASAGIPLAISKLVSEYQTLGYYNVKKRVFLLARQLAIIFGIICFLIIVIFAPLFAKLILGDITGGNSLEDVVFVLRVIGTAILVVPVLGVYRGYFEGHRFMSPPSISQVLEQLLRVLIIIFGSLFAVRVFNLNLSTTVGIALFGATAGAIVSYLYLVDKKKKNESKFNEKIRNINEPIVTNKEILRKIFIYAFPFIMIDIFKSLYNYVDLISVVKGLVKYAEFSVDNAETIYSMISTWGQKFNMIIFAISTGIIVSLIPSLTESFVKKDNDDIDKRATQGLNMLLFLIIPMTLGISFLSKPIWTLFYGNSIYGPSVLSYFIFEGLFIALFTCMITVLQVIKDYKMVFISLLSVVLIKIIFNNTFILSFYQIGLPAYYGIITATILGYIISTIICMVTLYSKHNIKFKNTFNYFIEMMIGSILMIIVLFILSLIIPIYSKVRIVNLFIILLYALVGATVYFIYVYKVKLLSNIFGRNFINKIKNIILKK